VINMPPTPDGQFHKKLRLIRNDDDAVVGVAASGPISLENATSATLDVTIEQDGVTVTGRTEVEQPGRDWMIALPTVELGTGEATGTASAVFRSGDTTTDLRWSDPVHLV
jgi:hypothetical protein